MNAVGIDVSKGKSMVAVRRPFNETVAKPFEVRHTGSELKQLTDYLKIQAAFVQRYAKWCKQHRYQARAGWAESIYEGAKDLIAMLPKDAMTKLLVRLKAEMLKLASQLPEFPVVMAMRGVGDSLGPQLIAEIGDVTRFAHRSAITSFAGVDPGANQSGSHQAKSVRISKSGSPELRKALFLVMDCLIQTKPQDDPVYQFMDKKRAEGKPYLVYMTAGANKFLRVYYDRVKEYLAALEGDPAPNSGEYT